MSDRCVSKNRGDLIRLYKVMTQNWEAFLVFAQLCRNCWLHNGNSTLAWQQYPAGASQTRKHGWLDRTDPSFCEHPLTVLMSAPHDPTSYAPSPPHAGGEVKTLHCQAMYVRIIKQITAIFGFQRRQRGPLNQNTLHSWGCMGTRKHSLLW